MRICMTQNRPRFEVMQWPADELEWWSIYFSIKDNGDKPRKAEIIEKKRNSMSVEQSKADLRAMMW